METKKIGKAIEDMTSILAELKKEVAESQELSSKLSELTQQAYTFCELFGKYRQQEQIKAYFKIIKDIKEKHRDAIFLVRIGDDDYVTYNEDAKIIAGITGDTIQEEKVGNEMFEACSFCCHSLDTYLPKMIRKGYRVVICDTLK